MAKDLLARFINHHGNVSELTDARAPLTGAGAPPGLKTPALNDSLLHTTKQRRTKQDSTVQYPGCKSLIVDYKDEC